MNNDKLLILLAEEIKTLIEVMSLTREQHVLYRKMMDERLDAIVLSLRDLNVSLEKIEQTVKYLDTDFLSQ